MDADTIRECLEADPHTKAIFNGIYCSDDVPALTPGKAIIINTAPHKQGNRVSWMKKRERDRFMSREKRVRERERDSFE